MIDEDFGWLLIGDDECRTLVCCFIVSGVRTSLDNKESSGKVFWILFVGVENISRRSIWGVDEGCIDGLSCKITYGFVDKRDDDVDDKSSRSCSGSDNDGVETDEAIDDERCFWWLEQSIWKYNYSFKYLFWIFSYYN